MIRWVRSYVQSVDRLLNYLAKEDTISRFLAFFVVLFVAFMLPAAALASLVLFAFTLAFAALVAIPWLLVPLVLALLFVTYREVVKYLKESKK